MPCVMSIERDECRARQKGQADEVGTRKEHIKFLCLTSMQVRLNVRRNGGRNTRWSGCIAS